MERVDGISDANLEDQNRLRQRASMTEAQREKRKSEVLIAAQSIDNEVQNVKSLKRISIGSMDLLIDPEMEFRVNATSPQGRKSWSSTSSSSGEEYDVAPVAEKSVEEEDTTASDLADDSFDTTGADYLQTTNNSPVVSELTSPVGLSSPQTSVRRTLTGTGSLRRGGVTMPATRKRSSGSDSGSEENTSSSSLTKQLLWVPANQHPSVKPENFLELVQDTLHNIQLDESGDSADDENLESFKENMNAFDRLPLDIARKRDSLVRRPSRLRKSYTEFEEYDQEELSDELVTFGKDSLSSSGRASRTVSLKDITEELNKISNNAGLTSSDAITLARTLSMAGSFTSSDINTSHDNSKNNVIHHGQGDVDVNEEDDNEYASNMLMKHGVVIPARSSLRRSKFNTYRVRSSGSSLSLEDEHSSNEREQDAKRNLSGSLEGAKVGSPSKDGIPSFPPSPSVKGDNSIVSSPTSVNDFQDIYDHYRQSSIDWENDFKENSENSAAGRNDHQAEFRKLPPRNDVKPNADRLSAEQESSTISRESKDKRSGWSWLSGISNRDTSYEDQAKDSKEDVSGTDKESSDLVMDEDFEKTTSPVVTGADRPTTQRSNHSKNRHLPILPTNDSPNKMDKDGASNVIKSGRSSSLDSSRQTFEKKIANLFRRKGKKKPPSYNASKNHAGVGLSSKTSSENLTKLGKTSKIAFKLRSESRVEEHLRKSTPKEGISNASQNVSLDAKTEELPALQPAVSVTSTKSQQGPLESSVVESVKEFDGDDSQDMSMTEEVQTSIDISKETLIMKEQTSEAHQGPKETPLKTPSESSSQLLPPRKLTFDDVKRPERPNAPMKFTDSAFGFPLPMLTVSTVIMFDHRLPINVERAIYRLSHLKLSDPKRELRQQVVLSNFMYAYLNLVNHTLYMEQVAQENDLNAEVNANAGYQIEQNSSNGSICIPDM